MNFIADTDDTYHIEKASAYLSVGRGIKTVEFVRKMKDNCLWFVEAKALFPDEVDKSKQSDWIKSICEKFLRSLNLYCTVKLNVVVDTLPCKFVENNVRFVLVIKEQSLGRCEKIQKTLKERLLPYLRIWKTSILVINQEIAIKHGIAIAKGDK
ncbi:MAG: hypothetical protein Ta2G_21830 [Termitinemataceae bacterium]|nr:MAG: hypothetical protein Ta2G_21830 [Termitinemataceae bacterium]